MARSSNRPGRSLREAGLAASEADRDLRPERWTILRYLVWLFRFGALSATIITGVMLFNAADRLTGTQLVGLAIIPMAWAVTLLFTAELVIWMVHLAVHTRGTHVALRELLVELRKPEVPGQHGHQDRD